MSSLNLIRHPARTLLAVLGVAVSAAMLLDMVMLATGMRESFRTLLLVRGFQLRIAPKGTLPFDTEATIDRAGEIRLALHAHPDIVTISPVLGASIHVPVDDGAVTAFGIGGDPRTQGDYEVREGRGALGGSEVVVSAALLQAIGAAIGDTIEVATGYDPQLRTYAGSRRLVIVGVARFLYLAANQRAAAITLATLQEMAGAEDRVSLFMVRAREGANVEAVRAWIEERIPWVTAISIETAIAQVDERLSYFRQLAFILGTVSLAVGFLLVTTLVTVSVNERIGEIAVMRAIGISRSTVVRQIVLEGMAISLAGSALGLVLGLATARYLNSILARFPGLPEAIDFFLFQPIAAWTALGLLIVSGMAAGIYPAWRAASLPIAATLREEAVG